MENLFQQTYRLLTESQRQMHDLSTFSSGNQEALEATVAQNVQQLEQDCYRLENLARKEPPTRRQEAKHRVDQLLVDFRVVQNAHHSYRKRKEAAEMETRQREELMSRRFAPNSESNDTSIPMLEENLHHHQRVQETNRNLDELIGNAAGIIGNLRNQGFTLKGAQRKILDISNTLGLSGTLMRLIEKRTAQDWWIFIIGLIVSITILVLVVMYLM